MPLLFASSTITQLESAGFTHIEARCCNITATPFQMLKEQGKVTEETTFGEIAGRLRCRRCGKGPTPDQVRPWRQYIDGAAGYAWGKGHQR